MTPLEKLKALQAAKATAVKLPDKIPVAEPVPVVEELIPVQQVDERLVPILELMSSIEETLQKENPEIELYMVKINQNLRQFPELIHLLTDEQIAPYYKAVLKQANIKLAPKKAAAKKKAEVVEITDDIFGLEGLGL